MSQNVIGPVSAACLFEYLISPTCPLERLILKSADVDDFECENFVKAIRENRSLIELDLSSNLIGKAENLNTVMPELTTGAEALADLLRMPECKIKTLRLDWNMIRLDGAIDLANSISSNQTLTFLDLSYNSLATGGGITLGVSLLANTTLETLILQNNNLDSVACFTICAGIIENRGLKKVALDGNPIGDNTHSRNDRSSKANDTCALRGAGNACRNDGASTRGQPSAGLGDEMQYPHKGRPLLVRFRQADERLLS